MKSSMSEVKFLDVCQLALTNAQDQPQIAALIAEMGYDEKKIAEGKALLKETQGLFETNKQDHIDASIAYAAFEELMKKVLKDYGLMRKKAKVVFRKEPVLMARLQIDGAMPVSYVNKIHIIRTFVSVVLDSVELQNRLAVLKVSKEELQHLNDEIIALNEARANYLKERGESQDATSAKDKAFARLDDWMNEFYAIARIALEDQPQLMEALGKIVR